MRKGKGSRNSRVQGGEPGFREGKMLEGEGEKEVIMNSVCLFGYGAAIPE